MSQLRNLKDRKKIYANQISGSSIGPTIGLSVNGSSRQGRVNSDHDVFVHVKMAIRSFLAWVMLLPW